MSEVPLCTGGWSGAVDFMHGMMIGVRGRNWGSAALSLVTGTLQPVTFDMQRDCEVSA